MHGYRLLRGRTVHEATQRFLPLIVADLPGGYEGTPGGGISILMLPNLTSQNSRLWQSCHETRRNHISGTDSSNPTWHGHLTCHNCCDQGLASFGQQANLRTQAVMCCREHHSFLH